MSFGAFSQSDTGMTRLIYPSYVDTVKLNALKRQNKSSQVNSAQFYNDSINKGLQIGYNDLESAKKGNLPHPERRFDSLNGIKNSFRWRAGTDSIKEEISVEGKKSVALMKERSKITSKDFSIKGNISNQLDYGAIPYYVSSPVFPASLYRSAGELGIRMKMLPIKLEYFYANPKFISGLNNYITIKLDVEEFQRLRNNKVLETSQALRKTRDSLQNEKIILQRRLTGYEILEKYKSENLSQPKAPLPINPGEGLNVKPPDSLTPPYNTSPFQDSVSKYQTLIDSNSQKIKELRSRIDFLDRQSAILEKRINSAEYPDPKGRLSSSFPETPLSRVVSGISKFEIGMCYPNYSAFMIGQTALNGINTKFRYKSVFVNATYGKTIVNYSVQPNANGLLNQVQALTEFFDMNKSSLQKNVAAAKVGLGKEDGNYIGIGALYGKGRQSVFSRNVSENYVIELDARVKYKFITFEGAIAKSYLPATTTTNMELIRSNDKSGNRSFQSKVYGIVPVVKTKFSFFYRILEPHFKSFGVAFMRSDILRYEAKLEQPIGSRLKAGLTYRRDEDNLRNLHAYKTVLSTYQYSLKLKPLKRLDILLNYTQIDQNTKNSLEKSNLLTQSDIKTMIITYLVKRRKLISTNNLIANIYALKNKDITNRLENYSFNSFNNRKKCVVNFLNSFNLSTMKDSANYTNSLNNTLEIGYQFTEGLRCVAGIKHAYAWESENSQWGYNLLIQFNLNKLCSIELKTEKLVIGDFINTLNYHGIKQFPYYTYLKVNTRF